MSKGNQIYIAVIGKKNVHFVCNMSLLITVVLLPSKQIIPGAIIFHACQFPQLFMYVSLQIKSFI